MNWIILRINFHEKKNRIHCRPETINLYVSIRYYMNNIKVWCNENKKRRFEMKLLSKSKNINTNQKP